MLEVSFSSVPKYITLLLIYKTKATKTRALGVTSGEDKWSKHFFEITRKSTRECHFSELMHGLIGKNVREKG